MKRSGSGTIPATETIKRQWQLLRLIPRLPRRITTAELHQRLSAETDCTVRTVQRDLNALSESFPITCDTMGRTQHWYWTKDARQLEIPGMSASMAATLLLVQDYLQPVLPASVLGELQPFFKRADELLESTKLRQWHRKVRLLDRGPPLIPPPVNLTVHETVTRALADGVCLRARYQGRNRTEPWTYRLSPLGLVVRNGIYYLVALQGEYDDPLHFALHRMQQATLLEEPVRQPKRWSLDRYIDDEAGFGYPLSPEKIKLEALFDAEAAVHLYESKLAADQVLTVQKDGRVRVKATVADTAELRWWLRGFGEGVEVVGPKGLEV